MELINKDTPQVNIRTLTDLLLHRLVQKTEIGRAHV